MTILKNIGFDADDTLWHDYSYFKSAQEQFCELFPSTFNLQLVLSSLERKQLENLPIYGYGAKGFGLAMYEVAIELLPPGIDFSAKLKRLESIIKNMITTTPKLLPNVIESLALLQSHFNLLLITKGDLFHQELKYDSSGLKKYFSEFVVVSRKDTMTYTKIFGKQTISPTGAMVGNSLRSDIIPALESGMYAAHVPYKETWTHEVAEEPAPTDRFLICSDILDAAEQLLAIA